MISFFVKIFVILGVFLAPVSTITAQETQLTLLEQHDESTILKVLTQEVPELTINSLTLISSGWDNLVADVNGEWIFRFPRSKAFCSILEREKFLLDRLHFEISMPTPHYKFYGKHTAFVGYQKIIGEPLLKDLYLSLSDEIRQDIAESLALFISQLHNAVSVEEAKEWGYPEYRLPLEWIENSLIGTLPNEEIERLVAEALAYAKEQPKDSSRQVLLHNDLHGENFAFDTKKQKVSGVFDFSDAATGDYAVEFGKLFCIHDDLVKRTTEAYSRLNNTENPIVYAAVDHILRRGLYILYNRDCGDIARERQLIGMLQRFVPVWDELVNCKI